MAIHTPELAEVPWKRQGAHGPWWIPDESPGKLGDPEIWVDETALEWYGRGDASPAVTVSPPPGRDGYEENQVTRGTWWGGAVIRFSGYPGLGDPVVYVVRMRRTGPENLNRPYYVLRWPD